MINSYPTKESTSIAGLTIESRKCENPICTKSFSVLTTSSQKHCTTTCASECGVEIKPPRKIPPQKPKPEKPANIVEKMIAEIPPVSVETKKELKKTLAPKAVDPEPQDVPRGTRTFETEWADAVKEAVLIKMAFGRARMEIASKALYVCEIVRGGGAHWDPNDTTYTVKKFAEDIGINYKTLSQWIRIKRNVFDKVGDAWMSLDFARAMRTDSIVDSETPAKKVLEVYLSNSKVTKDGNRIREVSKRLLFINKRIQSGKASKHELKLLPELLEAMKTLEKTIKKSLQ